MLQNYSNYHYAIVLKCKNKYFIRLLNNNFLEGYLLINFDENRQLIQKGWSKRNVTEKDLHYFGMSSGNFTIKT